MPIYRPRSASLRPYSALAGNLGKLAGTYLRRDVVPVMLAAQLLQVVPEQGAHLDDALRHAFDLAQPLLVEVLVVKDLGGDAGTVDGRVRV